MMQADTHSLPVIPDRVLNARGVLYNALFRSLWIATIVSNIGTTMQDVGASWLMTTLAPTPLMVSLIQTSGTLPIFMFSLISGALADIVSRRMLLLVTQGWMCLCAMAFALLTATHMIQPWSLLALNFGLATAAAFNIPPWQSLTSDIVDRDQLKQAVVMQSAGSNIARSVGPALGGIAVSFLGPAWVFGLNAVSFLGVMIVLLHWKPKLKLSRLPAERFFTALRTAIAYARHSDEMSSIIVRTFLFVFGASAAMGLLPLLVKERLHEGPKVLGVLLALNGAGAVSMAIWMKRLKIEPDDELTFGTIAYAIAIMLMAWTHDIVPYCIAMLLTGAGWLMANSTLNTATQLSSPDWVKARAVSIQQLTFYGSIALGSLCWGFVATRVHTHISLTFASLFLFVGLIAAKVAKISHAFDIKTQEAVFLPEPEVDHHHPIPMEHGPVMVTVEYVVEDMYREKFEAAMKENKNQRLKKGAMRWEVFCDTSNHLRYVEIFFSDTWADHLRMHERTTEQEQDLQEMIKTYSGGASPKITHYIYDTGVHIKHDTGGAPAHTHDHDHDHDHEH